MARTDTISSTERLLELIRGKNDFPSSPPETPPAAPRRSVFFDTFALRKPITIGVNISYQDLKLVKISRTSDTKLELVDFLEVPFEAGMSASSTGFPQFLKKTLTGFCSGFKHLEIWSVISSARVEIRYLRIPRIPRKQLPNAVLWSFRKEVTFNEKEDIFDFEVLGEINDKGVRKTEVMACSAPREEIQRLETLFLKAGWPLSGVTIIPFAIQNLFRTGWIEGKGKNLCCLYIGRDWSRIDIFSNGNLVLSRGIKAGMGSMIEAIRQELFKGASNHAIEMKNPVGLESMEPVEEVLPEQVEAARDIFFGFIEDASTGKEIAGFEVQKNDILRMILPALDRLVRQVDRTLEHYSMHFQNQGISRIYFSGPIGGQRLVINHIGEQLGLPIDTLDPFPEKSLVREGIQIPRTAREREFFVPAVGIALSSKAVTPNFIFTYKDKANVLKNRRINHSVFATLILLMMASIGTYFWQARAIVLKKAEVQALKSQAAKLTPYLDRKLIGELLEEINRKRLSVKTLSGRYLGLAAVGEISFLTPSAIRLSSIITEMGTPSTDKNKKKKQNNLLILDGVVYGNRLTFESLLADYLMKLKASPLFDRPTIKRKAFEFIGNQEVLRFTAEIQLMET